MIKTIRQVSWSLQLLKLESTLSEAELQGLKYYGHCANPRLVKAFGHPNEAWAKLVEYPLGNFIFGTYERELLRTMHDCAPRTHAERLLSYMPASIGSRSIKSLDKGYFDRIRVMRGDPGYKQLSDDTRAIKVLIIRNTSAGYTEEDSLCYMEELLTIRRRLGVVAVEIPGHIAWLKLQEMVT